jgi:S-formylglutathione hydrolase FrmB
MLDSLKKPFLKILFAIAVLIFQLPVLAAGVSINVKPELLQESFTGRVYVVIAPKSEKAQPLQANYWFSPVEIIAKEVSDWSGETPIVINREDIRYNKASSAENVEYEMQVLFRVNTRDANPFKSLNNIYSTAVSLSDAQHKNLDISVTADQIITPESPLAIKRPPASEQLIYKAFQSELLSDFHGQDYVVDMAVRLPKDFEKEPTKTWPVLYYISGMGGSEVEFLRLVKDKEAHFDEMITVSVNAMNYGGHSVFADSANTGPWASMLIKEVATYVDETYRGRGAEERYLTGISSGGWSSLWLQVKYPNDFAGTWSFVPDSVDFRDFQRLNLYSSDQNYYTDNLGDERLVARTGKGAVLIKSRDFIALENALGEGGQIRSFEYVFSPQGEDGLPMPFFDRVTGKVDIAVTNAWKPYDIRLHLKNNWASIGDDLKGKLNVYAGEKDQFFLEGAVRLLKEEMTYLGATEDIRIISGMTHAFDEDEVLKMLNTIAGKVEPAEESD